MCGKPCAQSEKTATSPNCKQSSAAQRGRDACGTATRISASLFRRLSVFVGSTSGQGSKAAKFAVLTPGPGMLVNVRNAPRVVIPPPSETPPVSACKPLCAILLRKPSVYPLSPVKANVGHLCEKLKSRMKNGWGIKFMAAALPDFPLLLVLRVHREPGNVCI